MRTIGAVLVFGAMFGVTCGYAACVPVEGDRIYGRELAVAHTRFADIDKDADLGPAPTAGSRRTFRYFELERLARGFGVLLEEGDPREACFERAISRLSEEVLQPLLETVLQKRPKFENAQIEIVDFSRQILPSGTPEFQDNGLDRFGMWRGRMTFGENRSVPIWARVHVVDEAGKTIVTGTISKEPEIGKGDKVRVEISSGRVLLAFDAAAESAGHVGEQVTVRNPVNGQRFRAIVEARGKVGIRK
jgi:hypothetical protein